MRFSWIAAGALAAQVDLVRAAPTSHSHETTRAGKTVSLSLSKYFNNKAFTTAPGVAGDGFDGSNQTYPASGLTTNGSWTSSDTGVFYTFPGYTGAYSSDNIVCSGEEIAVQPANYFSLNMLIASDLRDTIVAGNVTLNYADNTTSSAEMRAKPWWSFLTLYKGDIILPYRYTTNSTNWNTTHIFEWTGPIDTSKTLTSITLPETTNTTTGRIHVFAASLYQGSGVEAQYLRPTQKSDDGVQIVEVGINNAGSQWVSGEGIEISIEAPGVTTVEPAYIKRLMPGDQKKVNIGVTGAMNGTARVVISGKDCNMTASFEDVQIGLLEWTSELDSLTMHESPEWFNGAKYGIFIHWGPYAVPSWGNHTPHEVYAEWIWWYSHHLAADSADTNEYWLDTYGPDVVYDDLFDEFTGANFDAKEWVDLFDDAGAQYFVLTTKHHDGFALFDTEETSNRNALQYGPKRDVVKELFDAAKEFQPHIHRGTYFSLPEWYNPTYAPYGFAQAEGNASTSWPGILATNPYTGETEPYTGLVNVSDFITDLMVPQMEILAYNYETEIMWCDCGAANGTAEFASAWFNTARDQGREITINSRCGIPQGSDFDTPEYATFSSVSPRKWESNQGMDPKSYGFNRDTPDEFYMNATTIVYSLMDMVSKNGNFLLDVGPHADGTIYEVEAAHLRAAGTWIKANAEAIFNTTYWFVTPEVVDVTTGTDIRFTQTEDAFYITLLAAPESESVLVDAPVPILKGDKITAIGAGNGTELEWSFVAGKSSAMGIEITLPTAIVDAGEYAWVLKIEYEA